MTLKPEDEDFRAIEAQYGDTKSPAEKYRLMQARKLLRHAGYVPFINEQGEEMWTNPGEGPRTVIEID